MTTKELITKLREIESKSVGHDCVFRTHILDLCKAIELRDRVIEKMSDALEFYKNDLGLFSRDVAVKSIAECDRLLEGEK